MEDVPPSPPPCPLVYGTSPVQMEFFSSSFLPVASSFPAGLTMKFVFSLRGLEFSPAKINATVNPLYHTIVLLHFGIQA